jgi:ribonuclease BN (tRNA processing enzyme)
MDLVEAAYTMWWRRPHKLHAYGPAGLKEMVEGMAAMMAPDTRMRLSGAQPVEYPESYQVEVTEIRDGVVFEKDGFKIEAFSVSHGTIKPAFGYKVTANDRTIVISGDTAFSETLQEMATGVDILVHEVISDAGLEQNSAAFQAYHSQAHTPASELGRLASKAKPGLLVLYHGLYYGVPEARVLDEVRAHYGGEVVLANDLDIF